MSCDLSRFNPPVAPEGSFVERRIERLKGKLFQMAIKENNALAVTMGKEELSDRYRADQQIDQSTSAAVAILQAASIKGMTQAIPPRMIEPLLVVRDSTRPAGFR